MVRVVAVFVAIVFFSFRVVAGEQVLDQSWTDIARASAHTGVRGDWGIAAQTFTSGITGTISSVEVYAERQQDNHPNPGALGISIWSVSNGLPSVELAKRLVPHSAVPASQQPDWVSVDFTNAAIQATAGDQFAIVFSAEGTTTNYSWHGSLDNPSYSRGSALGYPYSLDEWLVGIPDRHYSHFFREYVDATVPEPSSIALASLGIVGLLIHRFRRPRRRQSASRTT